MVSCADYLYGIGLTVSTAPFGVRAIANRLAGHEGQGWRKAKKSFENHKTEYVRNRCEGAELLSFASIECNTVRNK